MTRAKVTSHMLPWREIAKPHQDIIRGRFDLSIFAANLYEVRTGKARDDYARPERFFRLTYLTDGLREVTESVLRRLSGKPGGEPVVDLMTSFGGGKTHALIAFYHLAQGDSKSRSWQDVASILDRVGVKLPPKARVVVLCGDDINPVTGVKGKGDEPTRKTLWGEMAWQLGGATAFATLSENDERSVSTSADDLAQLLGEGPNLILVDEALSYLTKARGVKVHDSNLASQTLTFFKSLSEAASRCPETCVVATMPTKVALEFGKEEEGLYRQLFHIFRRLEKNRKLSSGSDIYEIVRRRLFEHQGERPEDRHKVINEFIEYYRANEPNLPAGSATKEYQERMEKAYPFHPELLDILNERWGSVPNFQKTRGVLRMLALLVADLYKDDSSPLIQPSSVRLKNSDFRSEVLSQVDANAFDSVIESDIAGTGAKAEKVDQEGSALYQREHLAERTAAAIFLYSFGGSGSLSYATLPALRLAVLRPGLEPEYIPGVLEDLKKRLYYLQIDGDQYRFSVQPNLNRLRFDAEANADERVVEKKLRESVREQVVGSKFRLPAYPPGPSDVKDEAVPTLVVVGSDHTWEKAARTETEKFIQTILDGDATHRRYRNVLVFLIAEDEAKMRMAARTVVALDSVDRLYGHNGKLGESQKRDLLRMQSEFSNTLVQSIWTAYRIVVTPGAKGWEVRDLGHLIQSGRRTLQEEVWQLLVDKERLAPMLGPSQIAGSGAGVWPEDQDSISLRQLRDAFSEYTYLPMIPGPETLQDCVAKGVREGVFGLAMGDGMRFEAVRFKEPVDPATIPLTDKTWLLRPAAVERSRPSPVGTDGGSQEAVGVPTPAPFSGTFPSSVASLNTYAEVTVEGDLDWKKWPEFYEGVLRPLIATGANVEIKVQVSARSVGGIPRSVVDITVTENVSQRGLGVRIMTERSRPESESQSQG